MQERFIIDMVMIDFIICFLDLFIDDQYEVISLCFEFKGFVEVFLMIMIQWDGKVVGLVNVNVNGEWSWMLLLVLVSGFYVVSIVVKDKVGNELLQVDFFVVIFVIDVMFLIIKFSEESDSGVLGDFMMNNKMLILIGSMLFNMIVSIYVDGVKVGEVIVDIVG